jgi:hypothetical protein
MIDDLSDNFIIGGVIYEAVVANGSLKEFEVP